MASKKLTYSEQLKSPHWQRKRLEVLNAADWTCSCCGGKETTLHVHHRHYVKGRMAWEYEEHELAVLCEPCHAEEHEQRELLDTILMQANTSMGGAYPTAIGLLAGYFDAHLDLGPDVAAAAIQIDGHMFDLGVFAAIAGGAPWNKMAAAANIVRPRRLTPVMESVLERWESERGDGG